MNMIDIISFKLSYYLYFFAQDNVVCLPAKLAQSLGGMGRIATVLKVNSLVHLIDPNTGQCM